MKVRANMTRNVVCVGPDDALGEAHELMQDNEFRHLPVVVGEKLVGILSERDIFLHARKSEFEVVVPEMRVGDVMTRNVVTCRSTSSIAEAAGIMLDLKIGSLPVTSKEGVLIGLVTTTDLLELLRGQHDTSGYEGIPFDFELTRYAASAKQAADGFQ